MAVLCRPGITGLASSCRQQEKQGRGHRLGWEPMTRCGTGERYQKCGLLVALSNAGPRIRIGGNGFDPADDVLNPATNSRYFNLLRNFKRSIPKGASVQTSDCLAPRLPCLLAQSQTLNQLLVPLGVLAFEIRKMPPALTHQLQQASA